ncbi:unnamed protein product [Urochloa humidicola]
MTCEARSTHDARDERETSSRDTRAGQQGYARRHAGRSTCKEQAFVWPNGREDDDDDYDHPGRGRHASLGFSFFSLNDDEPVRRERTRSPRRRDGAFWRRRRPIDDDHAAYRTGGDSHHDDEDQPPVQSMLNDDDLRNKSVQDLQNLFAAHAYALKTTFAFLFNNKVSHIDASNPNMHMQMHVDNAQEYMEKACRFAARLGLDGDAAWSAAPASECEVEVSTARVFDRIKSSLQAPSVQDVEAALDALQFAGPPIQVTAAEFCSVPLQTASGAPEHAALGRAIQAAGPETGLMEGADGSCSKDTTADHDDTGPARTQAGPHAAKLVEGPDHHADTQEANDDIYDGIDTLFSTPPPPIVDQPPARRPRQRRIFDMTAVRRSARLAKKPTIPTVEKAQRNLCRKLRLTDDELVPLETVLAEFIGMFTGPLPEHIIAALTTIFGLEDEGADMLNAALLEHAGEGVEDLLLEDGPMVV